MGRIRDDAVCIRRWEWSETSQTVLLFCRELGLLRGLAKGSRRERAPFSGGFELLTRGVVHAIARPASSLATLTSWDLEESFPVIRTRLDCFHAGMYLAGLIGAALREHDPHPELYDELMRTLRCLESEEPANLLLRFQWRLAGEIGYRPDLARDVLTDGPVTPDPVLAFIPSRGGVSTLGRSADLDHWKARAATIRTLRELSEDGESALAARDRDDILRASRLLASYLRAILGVEVPGAESALTRPARPRDGAVSPG